MKQEYLERIKIVLDEFAANASECYSSESGFSEDALEGFIKCNAHFVSFSKSLSKPITLKGIGNTDSLNKIMNQIYDNYGVVRAEFDKLVARARIDAAIREYEFEGSISYGDENPEVLKLTSSQKESLQKLVDNIRLEISSSDWMKEEYQQRLLKKMNEFQIEMDKNMSSFYRGLGMLEDIGDSLGKFGKKAKPFTDRIVEVADSLKSSKRAYDQIGKDIDPLQISDMSSDEE